VYRNDLRVCLSSGSPLNTPAPWLPAVQNVGQRWLITK